MNRRQFLGSAAALSAGARAGQAKDPQALVAIAESLKPQLTRTPCKPVGLVQPQEDKTRFLQWRMQPAGTVAELEARTWRRGDSFILDFGEHLTGNLAFSLAGEGSAVDSPVRLKLIFGEVPNDVAVPMESYQGGLSRAWLPDEIVNVDFLPQRVSLPRRYAFRYVKVEVLDTSPNFAARFSRFEATALSSAVNRPPALDAPEIFRRIDAVSLNTLRDCMQTVFEDGPRRDRRLWVGDLRLQALTNYCSFKNFDLVRRCLYLFAGLPREDGLVAACIYDQPKPLCGRQFIMDYSVLFAPTVLDYVKASKDLAAGRDLWPSVRRQFEIVGQYVNSDGLFTDPGGWWIFIDWCEELDRRASMHGILLYCYRQALELARLVGAERDAAGYQERIDRMTKAARAAFYDPARKLFISGEKRQISWASQAWLIHAGVASQEEGVAALRAVTELAEAVRPVTPYLYHYVVDAMLACGMKAEARELIRSYWGGMVESGADTFWEVYDPKRPLLSPYGSLLANSYCHAWSCTPSYFLRTYTT